MTLRSRLERLELARAAELEPLGPVWVDMFDTGRLEDLRAIIRESCPIGLTEAEVKQMQECG